MNKKLLFLFLMIPVSSVSFGITMPDIRNIKNVPYPVTKVITLEGGDNTGASDVSALVQSLVDAATTSISIAFPPGTYLWNSTVFVGSHSAVAFVGSNELFADPPGADIPTKIYCKNITGPTIQMSTATSNVSLNVIGMFFDGANGAGITQGSLTWSGVFTGPTVPVSAMNTFLVEFHHVKIANSRKSSAIAIDLDGSVFAEVDHCYITGFTDGYAVTYRNRSGQTPTTLVVNRSYLANCRQLFHARAYIDCSVYDSVFESSGVAIVNELSDMNVVGCHFENAAGYASIVGGATTAITLYDALGQIGAPATNITEVCTTLLGSMRFEACSFSQVDSRDILAGYGSPTASVLNPSASIKTVNCRFTPATGKMVFKPTAGGQFVYVNEGSGELGATSLHGADATSTRRLTAGNDQIDMTVSISANAYIRSGLLQMTGSATEYLQAGNGPVGTGFWAGDILYSPEPATFGFIGSVCTVGGFPGTWKTFGAVTP